MFLLSDFSSIEEARFFAKALGRLEFQSIPSGTNQELKNLSNELNMVSPDTIMRRLSLLALPNEVQTMVDQGTILLGVAEIISRLRSIDDKFMYLFFCIVYKSYPKLS